MLCKSKLLITVVIDKINELKIKLQEYNEQQIEHVTHIIKKVKNKL